MITALLLAYVPWLLIAFSLSFLWQVLRSGKAVIYARGDSPIAYWLLVGAGGAVLALALSVALGL
jgi:hypothetical protein